MRKRSLLFLGLSCLLAGCQTPPAQAQAEPPYEPVVGAKAPNDPEAGATLCTPTEDVVISCRLKDNSEIASICFSPTKEGEPRKVRFVQGVLGTEPVLQHVADGRDSKSMFRWNRLLRAGPTGAYVYTFEHDGLRYGFYKEEGTYHALAGLFKSQPASPRAINDRACEMGTVVTSFDTDLIDLRKTWREDPQIYEDDLPVVDDNGSK